MGTVELKTSLHQLIEGVTDNSVLEAVYTLLSKATNNAGDDWYNSLSDEEKAAIDRGLNDADNKRFVPYSDVKAKSDKLLGR
ncbi:MAG: hypothetical protein IT221_01050 [Fluviicola sp.]|jgi:predicted transcriptional regulator|nr:hypothetical protein [Fluviicola sp.]